MKLNPDDGRAYEFWYPAPRLEDIRILAIEGNGQGAKIYKLTGKDELSRALIGYSKDLGVREVRDASGNVIKRFILVQQEDANHNIIRYIGYDAWGMEIVRFYDDEATLNLEEKTPEGKPLVKVYEIDTDKNLTKQIGVVEETAKVITLPGGHSAKILQRKDMEGKVIRIFGVALSTGEEIMQFFNRPQVINNQFIQGIVIVDLGEKTSVLPEAIRNQRGYEGDEPLKRIYYFDNDFNIRVSNPEILSGDNLDKVVGWAVETKNKIEGYDWILREEMTLGGELLKGLAVDEAGDTKAKISREFNTIDISRKDYDKANQGEVVSMSYELKKVKANLYTIDSSKQKGFVRYKGLLITNEGKCRELPVFAVFKDNNLLTTVVTDIDTGDDWGRIRGNMIEVISNDGKVASGITNWGKRKGFIT